MKRRPSGNLTTINNRINFIFSGSPIARVITNINDRFWRSCVKRISFNDIHFAIIIGKLCSIKGNRHKCPCIRLITDLNGTSRTIEDGKIIAHPRGIGRSVCFCPIQSTSITKSAPYATSSINLTISRPTGRTMTVIITIPKVKVFPASNQVHLMINSCLNSKVHSRKMRNIHVLYVPTQLSAIIINTIHPRSEIPLYKARPILGRRHIQRTT